MSAKARASVSAKQQVLLSGEIEISLDEGEANVAETLWVIKLQVLYWVIVIASDFMAQGLIMVFQIRKTGYNWH